DPVDRISVTLFKPNQDNHEKCEITYPHKTIEQNYNCVIERVDNWLLNKKEHLQINLHREHFRKSDVVLNLNDAGEYKENELYFLTFSLTYENKPKLINLENYSYYSEY